MHMNLIKMLHIVQSFLNHIRQRKHEERAGKARQGKTEQLWCAGSRAPLEMLGEMRRQGQVLHWCSHLPASLAYISDKLERHCWQLLLTGGCLMSS